MDETSRSLPEVRVQPAQSTILDDELAGHIIIEMLIKLYARGPDVPVTPEAEAVLRRLLALPAPTIVDVDPLDVPSVPVHALDQ